MTLSVIKSVATSLVVASAFQCFLHYIQSDFIFIFLKSNLTNIQLALLAINIATLSIVFAKIREIIDRTGTREVFDATKKEIVLSIKEQAALIFVSLFVMALEGAKNLPIAIPSDIFQVALVACFYYSVLILYDTAKSIFIILD